MARSGGSSPFGVAEFLSFWWPNPRRRRLLVGLIASAWLCFFSAQWFRVAKNLSGGGRALGFVPEATYLPPGAVLRIAALGHQAFLADLVFLQATQYFVRHLVTDSQLPWLDAYLEAIWALDATCGSSYRWGSQFVKFGQRVDRDVSVRANRFARIGLEAKPDDPWLYHEIAYNLKYAMEPRNLEEKEHFRQLAVRYLEMAYSFPGFTYDPMYLASQYARAGHVDESIKSALVNYAAANEDQRRELRNMLTERNRAADAAELAWLDVTHQRDWPYLPAGLALLIGPKRQLAPPLAAADPSQWLRPLATPRELLERLVVREMQPPPGERPADSEWPMELGAPPTPTYAD